MILSPFILLTKEGRKEIGIRSPKKWYWLVISLVLGGTISIAAYWLGSLLYGNTITNWFVYIGSSYPVDLPSLSSSDKQIYFIIYCVIGSFFSPFGEELLYRGLIHRSLTQKFSEQTSGMMDSLAFGLTHLAHFGIVYTLDRWTFLPIPAVLWVFIIFSTGMLFNWCKSKSESIWGAVAAHIGFNLVMT